MPILKVLARRGRPIDPVHRKPHHPDDHVPLTLAEPQKRALKYLATAEGEREGMARPSKVSLAELARGRLARKTRTALGYSITARGRGAYQHVRWDEVW